MIMNLKDFKFMNFCEFLNVTEFKNKKSIGKIATVYYLFFKGNKTEK